jgi:Domain of Unknown Function with PDB structure (DUF3857)
MFRFMAGVLVALALAGVSRAADQPQYGPAPSWVKPIAVPTDAKPGGAAVQVLLRNDQMDFEPDGDSFYTEAATKVLSQQGLQLVGNIIFTWQPSTDTLTIHRLEIIRGTEVIDLTGGGKKVTVLRRETDLERAMLDGSLTATIQPEGLQVGDIVHFAYTIKRSDPVLAGRSQGFWILGQARIGHAYMRAIWPASKTIAWRATEGLATPAVNRATGVGELVLDMSDAQSPKPPAGAPARYDDLGQLQLSDFKTWSDVAGIMAPLYVKAAALGPDSAVRAEARKIAATTSDPAQRALAALQLVQNDVRYLFLGMGQGGLTPADADVTWARRFGDCKAKTALLLALLHELGVEAQPALVSTVLGDGLDQRLPNAQLFDHVLVRAVIGGKVYWLDGTRTGDRSLGDIAIPGFHWALPLAAQGSTLERLQPARYATPRYESLVTLDATGGLDAPAPAHAVHTLRGDGAIALHEALAADEDRDRTLKTYWRDAISWIDPQKVGFTYDEATVTMTVSMEGSAKIDWAASEGGARDFNVTDSSLGWDVTYARDSGPNADAPYAVEFPMYKTWTVTLRLPNAGAGFSLVNADPVDRTAAGIRFRRHAELKDGVVTIVADQQALEPEFPASQAKADSAAMREMADYDVTVRAANAGNPSAGGADAQATLAGLVDAVKKAQGGDAAGAYAQLKPLVLTAGFGQLDAPRRGAGLFILAWSAAQQKDYATTLDAAAKSVALAPDNQQAWWLRLSAASEQKSYDDEAVSIAMTARKWPALLKNLPDTAIFFVNRQVYGQTRLDLLSALYEAKWTPLSKASSPSSLWLTLTMDLLAKGDLKQAILVAHGVTAYGDLIAMHADRRFDPVVQADPGAFDVAKAIDLDLAKRRADVAAAPTKLEYVNALAMALIERGKSAEALAVVRAALSKSQVGDDGKAYFDDLDDQLNRALEAESIALRELGRDDESLKAQQRGAAHAEHGGFNVSQTLDLAERFDAMGRPQEALDALQDFDPRRTSPYGAMVWRTDLVCAYAQLKDQAKVEAYLAYMKAHARDNPGELQGALLCAGDADGLAKSIIGGIEDPETRTTVLVGMQDYLHDPAPQSAWQKDRLDFQRRVWDRPDVRAAVAKYGRIEKYPLRLLD